MTVDLGKAYPGQTGGDLSPIYFRNTLEFSHRSLGGGWSGILSWKCCLRGSNLENGGSEVEGKNVLYIHVNPAAEGRSKRQANTALEVNILTSRQNI